MKSIISNLAYSPLFRSRTAVGNIGVRDNQYVEINDRYLTISVAIQTAATGAVVCMPSHYGLLETALEPQTICALDPSSDPSYRRYLDKVLRVHGKVCRQKDCLITIK